MRAFIKRAILFLWWKERVYCKRQWAKQWELRSRYYHNFLRNKEIDELLASTNIFFVLGTGRSGTQILSSVLNKDENSSVYHEPDHYEDIFVMNSCYKDPLYTLKYINQFRKISIYQRIKSDGLGTYGEVTGMLRYQVSTLKKVIPNIKLLLLARDGRDVVRSIMGGFPHYKDGAKGAFNIKPLDWDPYLQQWSSMSRFEKICWSWMDSYRLLVQHIPKENIVHLEKLSKDFTYFKQKVIDPLGLYIEFEQWQEGFSKPKNETKVYKFPHWKDWSLEEKDAFDRICAPTMEELGYDLSFSLG